MKNIVNYLLLFSLTTSSFAQVLNTPEAIDDSPYRNIRESKSALISGAKRESVREIYNDSKLMQTLREIIKDTKINKCATKTIGAIKLEMADRQIENAILSLRMSDDIDDIAAGILLKAAKINAPLAVPLAKNELSSEEEDRALEIFATSSKELKNKTSCPEDTYRALISKFEKESPKFVKNLKHIDKLALEQGLINDAEFKTMERFRSNKVHQWPLTLASYSRSLEIIAKSFPDRMKESSDLMTDNSEGKFRNKMSLRQSLYEKYDARQIMLLANMARDLKSRLEAKTITININYDDRPAEIIDLTPMEKFRFILKLLRKELSTLNNSTVLNGNRARYIDVIAAAYEVGYVSAGEIEQLAALEDIWNPKKTTKEKVMTWTKRFGGVASVLLPPPFGFVSVLAIMLIDQYISESPIDRDPDYNIF